LDLNAPLPQCEYSWNDWFLRPTGVSRFSGAVCLTLTQGRHSTNAHKNTIEAGGWTSHLRRSCTRIRLVIQRCSSLTTTMLISCIICSAGASPELQLQYCDACQSALYCSEACQRIDWSKQHKKKCELLNVGHGGMQLWIDSHTSRQSNLKEAFEEGERSLSEDMKIFFKLFTESTFEGSQTKAQKMKKIAKRYIKHDQMSLLFHSLNFLVRSSNSEMLSWPNSPLLVMLQFVDPNVLIGDEDNRITLLHYVADLADPFDYSTHVNQVILAKGLVEHGANVNAISSPNGETPLHRACFSDFLFNLDFVERLLKKMPNQMPKTV
jgi:hypothetical protein